MALSSQRTTAVLADRWSYTGYDIFAIYHDTCFDWVLEFWVPDQD